MKNRLKHLARRIILRFSGLLAVLALPHVPTRRGINAVVAEHYGLAIGRHFETDDEAAQHYFRTGWKSGVVPNATIDFPDARFSPVAALRLRNALAQLAWRGHAGRSLGSPTRLLDKQDFTERHPERLSAGAGWVGAIMGLPAHQLSQLQLRVGTRTLSWDEYRAEAARLIPATRRALDERLLDVDFYRAQIGGHRFVSAQAALDDYVANGELDGRTPHPFFEAEWYEAFDRTQVRRGRPANQFLDFVALGETGQASPHFWGHRYLESTLGRDAIRPLSLLAHFTTHTSRADLTPASNGITPVRRDAAERIVRERVAAYHRDLGLLTPGSATMPRHRVVTPTAPAGTLTVLVDARDLDAEAADALERQIAAQHPGLVEVVIIDSPATAPSAYLSDPTLPIRLERRQGTERMGSVAARVVEGTDTVGWTFWTPAQEWAPHFAHDMLGALAADPRLRAAAAVTPTLPQSWMALDDPTWLQSLGGEGVVFRAGGGAATPPAGRLEVGLMEDALLRASVGSCGAVRDASIAELRPTRLNVSAQRAGANAARGLRLADFADAPATKPGISVVIPTWEDWEMTATAVRGVLENSDTIPVEVVVVDNGSRRPVSTALAATFAAHPEVRIHRVPRNTDFALGCNIGAVVAATDTIVFLNNDTQVQKGWIAPLVETLEDPDVVGVQPLLLYGDRTVQAAGTIFLGGLSMPRHLYAGVHPLDVADVVDDYAFSAITAACMAVRFADFAAVDGFDLRYVNGMEDLDLCRKLARLRGGHHRVRTGATVLHFESKTPGRGLHILWNRMRFTTLWRDELVETLNDRHLLDAEPVSIGDVRWLPQGLSPLREPEIVWRRTAAASVNEALPRLRWAIKTSTSGDLIGDTWGDEFFAQDLADALRRRGQDAVVDRRTSHSRLGSDQWDDVTLTLRGLLPFTPQPDAINLLWVISHPDMVTADEVYSGFDRVYAAGRVWAAKATGLWGRPVHTLLQATNAHRFRPAADGAPREHGALFVGRTRAVARPIVMDAIAAGCDLEVYGDDGWDQFIDPRFVRGTGIPNSELPHAYATASFVLNDHWRDMAQEGFYSNRLFDAAAAGARIISDDVPGLAEVFGAQVRTYSTVADLRQILADDAEWPSGDELRALAHGVAERHSFDARAATLIDDAMKIRSEKP